MSVVVGAKKNTKGGAVKSAPTTEAVATEKKGKKK